MKPEEIYIQQVLDLLPPGAVREQIAMELRSLVADRIEHGSSPEEAIRQLGDPRILAESYAQAIPLVRAPHGRRLAAKLVDFTLLFGAPVAIGCYGVLVKGMPHRDSFVLPMLWIIFCVVATFLLCLYPWLAEYSTGQTVGKRLFGLRVVTEKGTRISLGQSFLRQMPIFLQIFTVDALFALFTEKRQRAFELISKTRVVVAEEAPQGHAIAAGAA
jgi:uncharacterized RDD family membrane protein YckC